MLQFKTIYYALFPFRIMCFLLQAEQGYFINIKGQHVYKSDGFPVEHLCRPCIPCHQKQKC